MIDLHQGFTKDELKDLPPSAASVAIAQLEVAADLARGKVKRAARKQLGTFRMLGDVVRDAIRQRHKR